MNGTPAVQELQQIFKHKSLNDVYITGDGSVRARFPVDSGKLIKDILRSNIQAAHDHPVAQLPLIPTDCSKKFTSRPITVRKRFVPAAQKVLERCLMPGVICNDVLSALQGLARVIVAICSVRRLSSAISPMSPLSRPKSWSLSASSELRSEHIRHRMASGRHHLISSRSNEELLSRKGSRESLGSVGNLESLKRCSLATLDPLITQLTTNGREKVDQPMFECVLTVIQQLCDAVNSDIEPDLIEEEGDTLYDVRREVFTKKHVETIDQVQAHFTCGNTEVTLPIATRHIVRRSTNCVVKKPAPVMRRTLSDAKRYFTSQDRYSVSTPLDRHCTSASSQETVRNSVISSDSVSSASSGSYDEEGMAKHLPRHQKKKIRAVMAQTAVPVGVNMRRRTSNTITTAEAIQLGVTMSQIRRSAIGEESDSSDIDNSFSIGSSLRDSGIDTISSTYTSIAHSDDEEEEYINNKRRSLSAIGGHGRFDLSGDEFLSIEVSGELGGHFSKSKKTLGQSPNNMGRYFRIHVKTNIDKLQLQSYMIYKKFKDVITLYEEIEKICPDGISALEKPDRSIFNKKQNKLQVERLLLSVASNNKLRTLEPVINFLKPDCLPAEDRSTVVPKTPLCNTPPQSDTVNSNSDESVREHPQATQECEIAKFYTPDVSTGPPGTDHAPQHINGPGANSPNSVRKTFRNLLHQKSQAEEKVDDEEYNPVIIKDDKSNPILLMTWSYEKEGYTVEGGKLEQLVEQLYSGNCPDADYIQTFLLGYKQIMQPEELMDMLISKFEDSQESTDKDADMVKLRLSNIVTQWLERVWVDFHYNDDMIEKVDKFIQLVSSGHPHFLPVAMKLENTVQKKKREWEESLRDEKHGTGSEPGSQTTSPTQSPTVIIRSNSDTKNKKRFGPGKPLTMTDINTAQFARHMHCVDFDLMAKVELHEYFTHFCRKKDPKYHLLTQHLDGWIHYWNSVSAWVTTEILRDETAKHRASKIERLIDIAKHLKQLFSFNMLYAFITGFNHSSVQRLKKTWDYVPSRAQSALADLEDLMSQDKSFSLYRKHQIKVPRTVCSIPLLSLILRDIEFLNVNSAKLKNGLWNFGKLRLIKNKISELERYKLIRPQNHIQPDDLILEYCRNLQHITTTTFYDISLEREPKDQPKPRPVSVSSLSSIATSSST